MMKTKIKMPVLLCALIIPMFFCATSFADILIGSLGYGWQSWNGASLNEDGSPYWDNSSGDGSRKNVGYLLDNKFSDYPAFWGNSSGGFDTDIYFKKTSAYSGAALTVEIAGYANYNSFGWYEWDSSGYTLHQIFAGSDSAASAGTFAPSAEYGFYLLNKTGHLFMSQAGAWGSTDPSFQHFAVFQQDPGVYWLGIEDLPGGGDKDYNDMVVQVAAAPVPEPATMLLLGSGLIGLATAGRRKFMKK
jgi:hypothetical protein